MITRRTILLLAGFVGFLGAVALVLTVAQAQGYNGDEYTLTVDGVQYAPAKIVGSGPTVHYFTPGTSTVGSAYTERHVWSGNGSGNLPCEGLLHWIDNANVLTISHCEEEPGTTTTTTVVVTTTRPSVTTTTPPTTTTTQPPTTTTTVPPTTTTTYPEIPTTTTRPPTTSTTMVGSTTTTTVVVSTTSTTLTLCGKGGDAPCGGVATGGGACSAVNEEGHPVCTQGSGAWGWLALGALFVILALLTLIGGLVRAMRRGAQEA